MPDDIFEPIFLEGELHFESDTPVFCEAQPDCCDVNICTPLQGSTDEVQIVNVDLYYAPVGVGGWYFTSDDLGVDEGVISFDITFRAKGFDPDPRALIKYRWEKKYKLVEGVPTGVTQKLSDGSSIPKPVPRKLIPSPSVSGFTFAAILNGNISYIAYNGPEDDQRLKDEGLDWEGMYVTVAPAVTCPLDPNLLIDDYYWKDLGTQFQEYDPTSMWIVDDSADFCKSQGPLGSERPTYNSEPTLVRDFSGYALYSKGISSIDGINISSPVSGDVFNANPPLMMMAFVSGPGIFSADYLLHMFGNVRSFRASCGENSYLQTIPGGFSIGVTGHVKQTSVYVPNKPANFIDDDSFIEEAVEALNATFNCSPQINHGMSASYIGLSTKHIGCCALISVRNTTFKNYANYADYLATGQLPENWYLNWFWEASVAVKVYDIVGAAVGPSNDAVGAYLSVFKSLPLSTLSAARDLQVNELGGFYTKDPNWAARVVRSITTWVKTTPVQMREYIDTLCRVSGTQSQLKDRVFRVGQPFGNPTGFYCTGAVINIPNVSFGSVTAPVTNGSAKLAF